MCPDGHAGSSYATLSGQKAAEPVNWAPEERVGVVRGADKGGAAPGADNSGDYCTSRPKGMGGGEGQRPREGMRGHRGAGADPCDSRARAGAVNAPTDFLSTPTLLLLAILIG